MANSESLSGTDPEPLWPSLESLQGEILEETDFRFGRGSRLTRWSPSFDVIPFDWLSLVLESDHPDSNWRVVDRKEEEGVFEVHVIETTGGAAFDRWALLWWDSGQLLCAELRLDAAAETDPTRTLEIWREGLETAPPERQLPPELPLRHEWGAAGLYLPQRWSQSEPAGRRDSEAAALRCFERKGDHGVGARMFLWESSKPARDALEDAIEELRSEGLEVQGGPAVAATDLGHSTGGTWMMCRMFAEDKELGSALLHLEFEQSAYVICCLHARRESDAASWAAGQRGTQYAIRTLLPN